MVLLKYLAGAIGIYLIYCGFLFVLQRQIIFPRFQFGSAPPISAYPGLESIWLPTSFGEIEAWLMPPPPENPVPYPVVIFAHGNAELIDFWPTEFSALTRMGVGVLLVEYPGYGRSQGAPSQRSIVEAFVAAYDQLIGRPEVDNDRVVLFGRSLGGGAVCGLAAQRPTAAMILMSTFTSVRAFALQFLAPSILIRDPFDNLAVVSSYDKPVLVVHGRNDDVISYRHGVRLFEAAQQGKILTYDCAHNDCPPDWALFWQEIEKFLQTNGILAKQMHP